MVNFFHFLFGSLKYGLYLWFMKKITHLRCTMNHTDLTEGKVYEVVEEINETLFRIKDDAGYKIYVTTNVYNAPYIPHREGWIPTEQPSLLDRTIFRNEWTAMVAIVLVITLVLLICKLAA